MVFNSYGFVFLFLPLSIFLFYIISKKNVDFAKFFLLGTSILFYGLFNISQVTILLLSAFSNFFLSVLIRKSENIKISKRLAFLGVALNLSLLVYFKYTNFFIGSINDIFNLSNTTLKLVIPIGLSYFTFQQISFLVDTYKDPTINYSLLDYLVYITFFGHIISGPIVRHDEFIQQIRKKSTFAVNYSNLYDGLVLFTIGLGKKVLISDKFGRAVDWGYSNLGQLGRIETLLIVLFFSFQIYFDFSGYSDMANGIAKMFNLDYPINFNSPYKTDNIDSFWKGWHITLTRFFTRYVYFPLGGNRKGNFRTYINIFIVFLLSGFWHGANLTFIVWGSLHGIASILYRKFKHVFELSGKVFQSISFFVFINFTWIFFRASSIGQAKAVIKNIVFGSNKAINSSITSHFDLYPIYILGSNLGIKVKQLQLISMGIFIILSFIIVYYLPNSNQIVKKNKGSLKFLFFISVVFLLSVLAFSEVSSFIYTNF